MGLETRTRIVEIEPKKLEKEEIIERVGDKGTKSDNPIAYTLSDLDQVKLYGNWDSQERSYLNVNFFACEE
jgi:hypothetical protein